MADEQPASQELTEENSASVEAVNEEKPPNDLTEGEPAASAEATVDNAEVQESAAETQDETAEATETQEEAAEEQTEETETQEEVAEEQAEATETQEEAAEEQAEATETQEEAAEEQAKETETQEEAAEEQAEETETQEEAAEEQAEATETQEEVAEEQAEETETQEEAAEEQAEAIETQEEAAEEQAEATEAQEEAADSTDSQAEAAETQPEAQPQATEAQAEAAEPENKVAEAEQQAQPTEDSQEAADENEADADEDASAAEASAAADNEDGKGSVSEAEGASVAQSNESERVRQEATKITEEVLEKAVAERMQAVESVSAGPPAAATEPREEEKEEASAPPRAPTLPEERERRDAAALAAEQRKQVQDDDEEAEEEEESLSTLKPVWAFGMNRQVPVLSLATPERDVIFYSCANSAILYDTQRNRQKLLRGHTNAITCTAASKDKRWLVTGDAGDDSVVIIWDSKTATPVRTMFDPHPNGVAAVALNPNSRYLCTLSAELDQTFAIWDWTTGDELSLCTATLSRSYGVQRHISFNTDDHAHVVTNSDSQVLFFHWGEGNVEYYAPPLTDKDFNKQVGRYCHSVFLRHTTKAISATSQGLCVVWDSNKPLTKMSTEATPDKRAVKLVPLHERSITVLTQTDDIIVTGDTAGHVKFFDQNLQLMYWYQHFKFGPISAISFKHQPLGGSEEERQSLKSQVADTSQYDSDATIPANPFYVRDFVIGCSTAIFATIDVKQSRAHIIQRDFDAAVHGLDVHPLAPRVAIAGYSGYIKVWNYTTKFTESSRHIDGGSKFAIRCIKFDPSGEFLAVGHANGLLRILDADTLSDVLPENFHFSRDTITHIAFSEDSTLLATADAEFTTSLYQRDVRNGEREWSYVGRNRAHYKEITDLLFGVQIDTGHHRLLSLGRDRYLVEYDIPNSSKDNLPILTCDRIEQNGVPLCMAWYPPIVKEQFLMTANDEYKYKLYNCSTRKCRNTFLGPTFGSPIQRLSVLPRPGATPADRRYAVFALNDKIGLTIMPLNGNPHNSVASIAHPEGVANVSCSPDGKYIFTAGGSDCCVQMWSVHTSVLDAQSTLGGKDLTPFYSLLDGGRDGELFKELEDYFYYAQLRAQGIDSMETRQVSERIPISEIPFVMRGLGYYPSEQEIENMMSEIKFSKYVDTGEYVNDIDLGQFIQLYVNHRPVFGLSVERIVKAFEALGNGENGQVAVDRGEILDQLQNNGEHMTEYELAEYLTTLLGFNPEGGSFELEEFDPSTAGELIETHIPPRISVNNFVEDLLGFGPVQVAASRASSSKTDQQKQRPKSVRIESSAQTS